MGIKFFLVLKLNLTLYNWNDLLNLDPCIQDCDLWNSLSLVFYYYVIIIFLSNQSITQLIDNQLLISFSKKSFNRTEKRTFSGYFPYDVEQYKQEKKFKVSKTKMHPFLAKDSSLVILIPFSFITKSCLSRQMKFSLEIFFFFFLTVCARDLFDSRIHLCFFHCDLICCCCFFFSFLITLNNIIIHRIYLGSFFLLVS